MTTPTHSHVHKPNRQTLYVVIALVLGIVVSRMDKRSASIKSNHQNQFQQMMDALRLSILHLFIRFYFV